MGLSHQVVGNCLSCGKIICALEGAGPCLFCGEPLHGVPEAPNGTLAEAVERKNALLDYEKRSVARSMIFDDQADYFTVDSQWMSQEEKTRLRELERERREKKQRRGVRMAVDLFGRRMVVTDDDSTLNVYEPFNLQELLGDKPTSVFHNPTIVTKGATNELRPQYVADGDATAAAAAAAPKKNREKTSAAAAAAAATSKRIQHLYFEVEGDDETQPQQSSETASSAPPSFQRSPFSVSGVVENVELESEPAACMSEADRARLVDLCAAQGASHYVLGLAMALPDAHVAACAARCRATGVTLVLSAKLPASLCFKAAGVACFARLVRLSQEHGVATVLVDCSQSSELDAQDKAGGLDTLAQLHHAVLAAVAAQLPRATCWLRPRYDTLEAASVPVAPHVRKYWNEVNELVPKQCAFVMLAASRSVNVGLSKEYAEALTALFASKARAVIVVDPYPSAARPLCLHPYSGRQVGLHTHWQGLLCCAGSSWSTSFVGVASALDYTRAPARYEAGESLARVLAQHVDDERVRAALAVVLLYAPTRLHAYHGKGERDLLRKRLDTAAQLELLERSLALLRSQGAWAADSADALRQDVLAPLEQLVAAKRAARTKAEAQLLRREKKKKAAAASRELKAANKK